MVCNILDFVETVFHLDVSLHNAPQGKQMSIISPLHTKKKRKLYDCTFFLYFTTDVRAYQNRVKPWIHMDLHTVLRIRIRMDPSYLGSRIRIRLEVRSRIRLRDKIQEL